MWVDSTKKSVQDRFRDPFKGDAERAQNTRFPSRFQGKRAARFAQIRYGIMAENAGCVITFVIRFVRSYAKVLHYKVLGGEGSRTAVHIVLLLRRSSSQFRHRALRFGQ